MSDLQELSYWGKIFFASKLIYKRPEFCVLAIFVVGYSIYMYLTNEHLFLNELDAKLKNDFIGFLIDFTTLLVVFLVWIFGITREWAESLNKFLSVGFITSENKVQIECLYAPLSGESDVRPMAQALGKSVNGNQNLPIEQMLNKITKRFIKDSSNSINNGIPFMSYEVEIKLTTALNKLEHPSGVPIQLSDNEYMYWAYPFGPITELNKKSHQV